MKILHIAPTPFFADRGCHLRILGEIRALQSQGHEIILATYHNGRDVENLRIKRIMNIPWYRKLEAGASWHKLYLDLLLLMKAIGIGLKEKPDIIHGHLHEGALIGKCVSLLLSGGRIPVIFDVQGSLTGELEAYGFFRGSRLLKNAFAALERIICKWPRCFVCSSESNAEFLKKNMNVSAEKVISLPDGIPPEFTVIPTDGEIREQFGISKSKKIVIYTGSLMRSKGVDYLIDSIPTIIKKFENVYFLMVGYPVQHSMEKVRNIGVADRVFFAGKVDYFELPKYLAAADVAVDPKVDEAGEGSGKIINYMGAGLPVVCFDTLNNRSILEDNYFFCKPGDTGDLADKIVQALENEELCKKLGEQNRRRVHKVFSWESNGKKLSELYLKSKRSDRN